MLVFQARFVVLRCGGQTYPYENITDIIMYSIEAAAPAPVLEQAFVEVASPVTYPLFMQCDPRWGNDTMGTNGDGERSTICGEGCAMSCVSMALNGLGVTIGGQQSDPQTLNAWLENNNGYMCADGDCNNLVLDSINTVSSGRLLFVSEAPKQSVADILEGISSGTMVYIGELCGGEGCCLR
jgi:hypothetical protein